MTMTTVSAPPASEARRSRCAKRTVLEGRGAPRPRGREAPPPHLVYIYIYRKWEEEGTKVADVSANGVFSNLRGKNEDGNHLKR